MAHQQNRNKALTTVGQVGRLRKGEKFYKGGIKLPYIVVDPFHKMGVKCHHPRRNGYSYFQPEILFAVDLRYVPLNFVNRPLATPQSQSKLVLVKRCVRN